MRGREETVVQDDNSTIKFDDDHDNYDDDNNDAKGMRMRMRTRLRMREDKHNDEKMTRR